MRSDLEVELSNKEREVSGINEQLIEAQNKIAAVTKEMEGLQEKLQEQYQQEKEEIVKVSTASDRASDRMLFLQSQWSIYYFVEYNLLSPPVQLARWAHMRHFLSVCRLLSVVCRLSGLDQKS